MKERVQKKQNTGLPINTPILLTSLAFGILAFLLPIYSKRIDASALEIGWLFSIFSITTLLLRPLIGRAIDKYGRKRFFVAAMFFYAVALGLFAISSTMTMLYIARLVQGIASSLMWISAYAIAADMATSENRGVIYGQLDESNARGALIGAFFGFYFLGQFPMDEGWVYLFLLYALFAIMAGYFAYRDVPETLPQKEDNLIEQKEKVSPFIYKIMVIVFITGLSSSMITPLLLIFLQDRFTTDIGQLAMAFIPAAIVYSVLPSKMGKFSDKYGRITLISLGLFSAGVISFFIPNLPSLTWLIVLWVFEAVGMTMALPALDALVSDISGSSVRGRGYGMYTFAGSLGAVFGPLLGGVLYDNISHSAPFYLNGIVLIITSLLAIILLRTKT